MIVVPVLFLLTAFAMPATFAQDRTQARSMTISQRGIVATSQTLASQAGAQVLARGGNAIDAAIAANAALGAVEPMMNGIGGDLFLIYREAKSGKIYGLNASGWSAGKMTREFLRKSGNYSMPQEGIHSVTVPGCVDGWAQMHKRFGKAKWAELFQPAIYYARSGFPVTEWIQAAWKDARYKLSNDKNAAAVFLREGRPPEVGEVFRNPQLAEALELIAKDGAKAFYRGPITKSILATSRRLGGVLEAADFGEYESEWVEPVSTTYRGWTVYELPPNGQGIAALSMLNLMEQFPLSSFGALSPEAFHRKIEAQKLAYADLNRYVGDPRFGKIPVAELISKPYAEKRAKSIDLEKASCAQEPGLALSSKGDTIYMSAVDAEGNVVSLIQSIYLSFGSGIVVDDYGFHLHNRGGLFTLDEDHINELKPRKRPFHTIIPGYMEKDGKHVGFGIMGGLNQAQAHAQFVSNMVDHEMNMQAALEAPRFTKLNFSRCDVMVERRVPAETQQALRTMGHDLDVQASFSSWMGGGQAVMHDSKNRVNYGASSPRKDGAAIPEPDPYFGRQD